MSNNYQVLHETRSILQHKGKGFICRSLAQVTSGDNEAYRAAYALIEEALPSGYVGSVLAYSHEPTTTDRNVIELLDRAIAGAQ